eukprot:4354001-Prymnesium_polylepis.2
MLDNAIAKITEVAGIPSPHNSSKEVVAEKKAGARDKMDKIEGDFKERINTALQLLKHITVRALAAPSPRTCIT